MNLILLKSTLLAVLVTASGLLSANTNWQGDLSAIDLDQWQLPQAEHLLSRAGFGGTPAQRQTLAEGGLKKAIEQLVYFKQLPRQSLPVFEHSGVFDDGLEPFPASRPALTRLAKRQGHALGITVKPGGNRPLQPMVDQFFYWLRASRLETDRVAYWWANRMLVSNRPLQEKMALFWHGHFANNEDKVRDYRKMLQQLILFQQLGLGDFEELLVAVAKNPAMLAFLDAGVNTKDSPNENFAREVMELFTMGVGHYSENDIREAARAFTGWNYSGLKFVRNAQLHDNAEKTFLGQRGPFDGTDVIDIILQQDVSANYLAAKLYRHFVRLDLDVKLQQQLGQRFKAMNYNVADYLALLFQSKDFYAQASIGSHIKSPIELLISTYKKAELKRVPGVPDFNITSEALGQRLMHPPTVAGWSQGRSWITPSLLFERGNVAMDLLFPDIAFIPPDRYPSYGSSILSVHKRLRQGLDISRATMAPDQDASTMAASNLLADRDEAFNTRLGSYRGWQKAIARVKPLSRHMATINLTQWVIDAKATTTLQVVDLLTARFMSVQLTPQRRQTLADFLAAELGSADIVGAKSYMEQPLRMLLHIILSQPEYQLG